MLLTTGCSERDVMEFTLEQSLSIALKLQCEEDPECLAALEAQLAGCIQQNEDLDALIAAGGSDDELSRRIGEDIAGCIVDEHGESFFRRTTSDIERELSGPQAPPPQVDVTVPAVIPR